MDEVDRIRPTRPVWPTPAGTDERKRRKRRDEEPEDEDEGEHKRGPKDRRGGSIDVFAGPAEGPHA